MNAPTRSERLALFLLSAALLLGMGLSYHWKNSFPFSLQVLPSSTAVKYEEVFETSKEVSLTRGKEEDFTRLPHVGPELAKRIVSYRETHGFRKKEDILQVRGIGAKTYEDLKDLLVLE